MLVKGRDSMLRLRELRKNKDMTMKELGKIIGVSEAAISQYETGKRQMSNEILLRLGEYFGVSVGYILGVEPKEDEKKSEITFDDFTYALQNETKTLTDMDKQILLSMAKQLNEARKTKDEGTN